MGVLAVGCFGVIRHRLLPVAFFVMDRHCDTRKASPYQQQMAVFQARNVSSSKIGTAILVANARSDRQLEEKIRSLEKVKDMEMRRLNWEQNQLRRSPNLRRHEMGR